MSSLPTIDIGPLLGYISTEEGYIHYEDAKNPIVEAAVAETVQKIYQACSQVGFFYIKIDAFPELTALIAKMEKSSHIFFDQPISVKNRIDMKTVGSAWRGFFRVGDEMTSGKPDIKEGLYLGWDLPATDPRVEAKVPMHGANIFPRSGDVQHPTPDTTTYPHSSFQYEQTPNDIELQSAIQSYLQWMKRLGLALLDGISLALGFHRYVLRQLLLTPANYQEEILQQRPESFISTQDIDPDTIPIDPLCLFRIFNYPAVEQYQRQFDQSGNITPSENNSPSNTTVPEVTPVADESSKNAASTGKTIYSVGEHTDYGLITILYQDNSGGLQIRDIQTADWVDAPPIANTFVVNLGDMLEKLTSGLFISTPHRVQNKKQSDRISFPFFFDPCFDSTMLSLLHMAPALQQRKQNNITAQQSSGVYKRWDGKEIGLSTFQGTYGQWIVSKVSKVFPVLAQQTSIEDKQ